MARIAGVNIPTQKKLGVALTYIYGIGKKLSNADIITVSYIVTKGVSGNGPSAFSYGGTLTKSDNTITNPQGTVSVTTVLGASGGGDIETIESIKYNAPRYYSSQYRAVTAQDYAVITKKIYDNAEAVVAYGGDSLTPPVYGKVYIVYGFNFFIRALNTQHGT